MIGSSLVIMSFSMIFQHKSCTLKLFLNPVTSHKSHAVFFIMLCNHCYIDSFA